MIDIISDLPSYVAGFKASGTVSKENYDFVVIPRIEQVVKEHGHIHFLLVLDTNVSNYTAGAWMSDLLVGLKHLTKWKKMAIVSNQENVKKITNIISPLIPGESKGFSHEQLEEAKAWVCSEA